LDSYIKLYEDKKGILRAFAVSAFPISEDSKEKIINKLQDLTQKKILLTCGSDPELIGGLRLTVGEKSFDGSVAARLDDLKELLNKKI
jgi:F-type H+-transporting ATPase subunit delta